MAIAGYQTQPFMTLRATATVEANTGDTTLTSANFGKIQTNTGATALIALTLPAANTVQGSVVRVQITGAQPVKVVPASGEKIYLAGSGVADKYLLIAGALGSFVELASDGNVYHVSRYNGVVSKEA